MICLNFQNQQLNQEPKQKELREVFSVEYRERVNDNFIKQLNRYGASVQPIITLRKLKTTLPSLKPAIKKELRSGVIYKISCPGWNTCYVGQTVRHIITRFKEHSGRRESPIIHFWNCVKRTAEFSNLDIDSTIKIHDHLDILEALYIREIKPDLNTNDEFRSKQLLIKMYSEISLSNAQGTKYFV